jgi:hypothetical protein
MENNKYYEKKQAKNRKKNTTPQKKQTNKNTKNTTWGNMAGYRNK